MLYLNDKCKFPAQSQREKLTQEMEFRGRWYRKYNSASWWINWINCHH